MQVIGSIAFSIIITASAASVTASETELFSEAYAILVEAEGATEAKREDALKKALQLLETVVAQYPDTVIAAQLQQGGVEVFGRSPISLGDLRRQLGFLDVALFDEALEALRGLDVSSSHPTLMRMAQILANAGQAERAMQVLEQVTMSNASFLRWQRPYLLAVAGETEMALSQVQDIESDHDRLYAQARIAGALAESGRRAEARSLAKQIKPFFADTAKMSAQDWAKAELSNAFAALGDAETAATLMRGIDLGGNTYPLISIASSHAKAGNAGDAIDALKFAVQSGDVGQSYRVGVAMDLAYAGSMEDALRVMDQAQDEASQARFQFAISGLYSRSGRQEDAMNAVASSFARQPYWYPNADLAERVCSVSRDDFRDELIDRMEARAKADHRGEYIYNIFVENLVMCGWPERALNHAREIDDNLKRALVLVRIAVSG